MRNPRKVRNIAMGAALFGGLALATVLLLHFFGSGPIWIVPVLGVIGLFAFLTGIAVAATAASYTRHLDRLCGGVDRIASWTVDPERWHAFLALNERLNAVPGNLIYRVAPDWLRGESVQFMAGRESLLLGDEFHWLPVRGSDKIVAVAWLDGPPPCIEIIVTSYGKRIITFPLRVPVPPGSEPDALRVLEHFRDRIPPPPRINVRLRRNVTLIFGAVMAVSTVVCAVLLRGATNEARGLLLIGTFVCGFFGVASLFLAWVLHGWLTHPLHNSQRDDASK